MHNLTEDYQRYLSDRLKMSIVVRENADHGRTKYSGKCRTENEGPNYRKLLWEKNRNKEYINMINLETRERSLERIPRQSITARFALCGIAAVSRPSVCLSVRP